MKKLFTLLALALAVASCQKDNNELNVVVGGEQDVNITVSLPDETRANSAEGFDFDHPNGHSIRYILEISYNGNLIRDFKITDSTSATFPVRLAPGRAYTFTVWADLVKSDKANVEVYSDADLYYNTSAGLSNITFKEWTPNVEARDAYTFTTPEPIKFGGTDGASNLSFELKRPFAKVRVVATDIAEIRKFGIEPTNAVAEYFTAEMYTKFDAVQGVASEVATKKHEFNYTDETRYESNPSDQFTVFADYVFVPEDGDVQFTLSVYDTTKGDDALIKANSFSTTIPVAKNKVTSIVGDILTEGGNVSITINGDLGEKETIKYVDNIYTLQDAINAAEDGKSTTIKLGGDVVIGDTTRAEQQYGLVIPAGKIIVLDLNGKTIRQTKECSHSYSMIANNGTLTILDGSETKSGKISFADSGEGDSTFGWGVYTINNSGNLIVNGGTIENISAQNTPGNIVHMYCAIQQGNSTAVTTINDGVISTPSYRSVRATNGEVVINGGEFKGQVWMQSDYHHTKLTIKDGTFQPMGGDGSSIFITNTNANGTTVKINGGYFMTKIGCSNPTKDDVKGCITGGTFTATAKENTNEALLANGYAFDEGEDGNYTVESKGYYTDTNGNYHITGAKGWLWMADQNDTFFGSKTVYLDNDIDFSGVDMRVTKMWTPEYSATFDGQNHTVSNIWMASNYSSNNQALFDGLMTVKNLYVDSASVYGMSQVGIIGANIFGNIENCHVTNSRSYGYVHHVGGIVGLHSWGEIKNCSVENTSIECYYYGAVGAIAGAMNEVSRKITGCSVKRCQVIKEGPEGVYPDWDPRFGIFVGYAYAPGTYVFTGEIENTTIKGVESTQAYGEVAAGSTVTVNGVQL